MNPLAFDVFIYIKFFISLFTVINPLGMIPIFASMTNYQSIEEKAHTNLSVNIAVALILCISLFLGEEILKFFGISINSFRIAGGVLICSVAFSMISGKLIKTDNTFNNSKLESVTNNVSIVPLAMPLIAGPGAISSTIVWGAHHSSLLFLLGGLITILFFSTFCWFLFHIAPCIVDFLGESGINIITRVMGVLLLALGVEFIQAGITSIFSGLFVFTT